MSIIEDRLAILDTVTLLRGGHNPDGKFCVMELAAHIAGEAWTDSPECVSPVVAQFMRTWNDQLDDTDRQMLKPLIPKLIGTRTSNADEETRAWMCTDWLVRECAPGFLRCAGFTEHAELLEQLPPYTSSKQATANQPTLDAAGAAAGAAAWAAAWAAAGDAAGDAAGAAAWAAAWAAAGDAAGAALRPTVKLLQASALLLVERMCEVGRA